MNRRTVAMLLAVCILALLPTAALAADFTDLEGHRAKDAIDIWAIMEVLNGYEDGTFKPDNPITRAELAAVLCRVLGIESYPPRMDPPTFADVPADAWYHFPVAALHMNNIMTGDGGGVMRPNDAVSRQEGVMLIARAVHMQSLETPAVPSPYEDAEDIADWAADTVDALYRRGHLGWATVDDTFFSPNKAITRAEVAELLYSMINFYSKNTGLIDLELVGSYEGNALFNKQLWLRNAAFVGDVILASGIGDGGVVLEDTDIFGVLHVGGGERLHLIDEVRFRALRIYREQLCITAFGNTAQWLIEEYGNRTSYFLDPTGFVTMYFGNYDFLPTGAMGDTFTKVSIRHETSLYLDEDMAVEELEIHTPATIRGQGTVNKLMIHSEGVTLEAGIKVERENITLDEGLSVLLGTESYSGG